MYINIINVNMGGTEVNNGTTFITSNLTIGFNVTIRIRATTGTYFSVPAVSETFTIRGNIF